MAQLSKILGSILRDMVSAQHEANMYALKLSAAYRNQNQAASINPPVVCLGEMDLMLHCAFTGENVTEEVYEVDQTLVNRTIQQLSMELSSVIVSCILPSIANHTSSKSQSDNDGPIARLNKEKPLRKNFIAFLGHNLYEYLKGHRAEYIALDGSIDQERLQEAILFVAGDKFLEQEELDDVFVNDYDGKMRKKIYEDLKTNLQVMLPRLLKDVQLGRPANYSSMDVSITSEELSMLPSTSIHSLKMTISPRDLLAERDEE